MLLVYFEIQTVKYVALLSYLFTATSQGASVYER